MEEQHWNITASNFAKLMLTDFWATICKTPGPMLSDRCLSCLSVASVYCGQTVAWIEMKLGTEVGLSAGHIVLDGHTAPSPPKGSQPSQFLAHVCCGQTA